MKASYSPLPLPLRLIPRRFIFERRVLDGIPSAAAAPSLPEIFQSTCSRTVRM